MGVQSEPMSQPKTQAVERLQRVILPRAGEPRDVRSLYLIEQDFNPSRATWSNRTSLSIPARCEISFETYFSAFPASYWHRWSQLEEVVLKVAVVGTARIDCYRSRIDGSRVALTGATVTDDTHEFVLSLAPFEDGGWMWFEVTAETDCEITEAGWWAPHSPGPQTLPNGKSVEPGEKRVTVGIPTFNRPADAVAALEALAEDPDVDAVIDAVIMPDQGTKHPADEPGYAAATAHFGDRFFEFRQGNLGGSGGYSRIMYEAVGPNTPDSPYIVYMDDDIAIEPDAILRALQVSRYTRTPMLIGGQMLNLQERSHLHSMGEVVDRHDFMWTSAPHVHYDHNFAAHPLSDQGKFDDKPDAPNSRDLHRRIDVDYNGWWMCMFPRQVAEEIGQPLPLFIKWDDAEFGLRAGKAGYPTASWPGIAIWHMAWSDKDDAIDWQAYFHLRNRLIVASLTLDGDAKRVTKGLIGSMEKATIKHLMCMEYSTVAIQNEAMRDFLAGPDFLFENLDKALPKVNEMRKQFPDAVKIASAAELPKPSGAPGVPIKDVGGRLGPLKKMVWLIRGVKHLVGKENRDHWETPQANWAPIEARWFSLSRVDGVTVTTADGTGVVYRKRDREKMLELWETSQALRKEVAERFGEMREKYRQAHPYLTSREGWRQIFEQ